MQRPVRIIQHRARHDDEIGLAVGEYLLGKVRRVDQADGTSCDVRAAAYRRCKRHLVAGVQGDLLLRRHPAAGTIDEIDLAAAFQQLREFDAAVEVPAAVDPVGGGYAHEQRLVVRPLGTHRVYDFQQITHAILEASTIAIRALVGQRRQEFVNQITVRRMHFQEIEARLARAPCVGSELRKRLVDRALLHRDGHAVRVTERNRRWRNGLPAAGIHRNALTALPRLCSRSFAPGMAELHAGDRALRFEKTHDAREFVALRIVPQAEAIWRDASARLGVHDFGENDAGAAHRARSQVLQMPVVGDAVGRRVLAHRRHHDAIARRDRTQRHRLEQMRYGGTLKNLAIVLTARGMRVGFFSGIHQISC